MDVARRPQQHILLQQPFAPAQQGGLVASQRRRGGSHVAPARHRARTEHYRDDVFVPSDARRLSTAPVADSKRLPRGNQELSRYTKAHAHKKLHSRGQPKAVVPFRAVKSQLQEAGENPRRTGVCIRLVMEDISDWPTDLAISCRTKIH